IVVVITVIVVITVVVIVVTVVVITVIVVTIVVTWVWSNVACALDGGHSAIDKPVGHGWFTGMRQQAGDGRDCALVHVGRPWEIVGREIIALRGVLHDVVPDGTGSRNTDDVVHDFVIAIASPDANRQVRSVAYRPVVTETIGCTGFGSRRTIQFERIAGIELVVTRWFIGKDAVDQEGHIGTHSLYTLGMRLIVLVEHVALVVRNL